MIQDMNRDECLDLLEQYLMNKLSAEDEKILIDYLSRNKKLTIWLEKQIFDSSNELDKVVKSKMLQNIFSQIQEKTSINPQRKRLTSKILRVAASILVPVLIATTTYFYMQSQTLYKQIYSKDNPFLIIVEKGEKASVELPDGSKVWINSASKLSYFNDYNSKHRYLKFTGEAYFEVFPNPEAPFIVECLDTQIEVLGTDFGIKSYDEDNVVSAVLKSGKIKMKILNESFTLKPNERLTYDRMNKTSTLTRVDATEFIDWKNDRLRFENETLKDIAVYIARMYNIEYEFETAEIGNFRFTGTLENANIETLLNTISLASPIKYKMVGQKIVFSEDATKKHLFKNK